MAIVKPVIFTSINDAETARGAPVTAETIRKMIQNSNMLSALAVIGSIRHVAINRPGVTTPNTDQWQGADASEITHLSSPLASVGPLLRFTPDFRNLYLRGAAAPTVNNTGGSYTVNLEHSHSIGGVCGPVNGEEGSEQRGYPGGCHTHTLGNDLSPTEPLEVYFYQIATYLKIN